MAGEDTSFTSIIPEGNVHTGTVRQRPSVMLKLMSQRPPPGFDEGVQVAHFHLSQDTTEGLHVEQAIDLAVYILAAGSSPLLARPAPRSVTTLAHVGSKHGVDPGLVPRSL